MITKDLEELELIAVLFCAQGKELNAQFIRDIAIRYARFYELQNAMRVYIDSSCNHSPERCQEFHNRINFSEN